MKSKILFLSALFSLSFACGADVIDNAMKLCRVFDATGMLSQEYEVSGGSFSVDVHIDTSSVEAMSICKQVSGMLQKDKVRFDRDWKIRIFSPFSNGKTIATCNLPS